MHLALRTSVAVVALGASLAGCGSSGGSKALTRAQIDAAANAICTAEAKAGNAVPRPSGTDIADAQKAAAYFDQIDPIIASTTAKLDALKPDSEVSSDWNAFIAARDAFSAKMHEIRQKADKADRSGLTDLQNLSTATLAAAATKVGAASCNEN